MKVIIIKGYNGLLRAEWMVACTEDKFSENYKKMTEWYDNVKAYELVVNDYSSIKLIAEAK